MTTRFTLSRISLAIAALAAAAAATATATTAQAAETAKTRGGSYVAGDFHNHTTCTDGTLSMQKLIDKAAGSQKGSWNLDWFVQADHGGSSARNCTLAEDPFTPVAPALGLTNSGTGPFPPNTYNGSGQPVVNTLSNGTTALKGPNQAWEATLPGGRAAIKGDLTTSTINGVASKNMWRWQEIKEFQYPITESEGKARNKPIWIGLELNTPGHEHTSTTILSGQKPWPAKASGNASLLAQYEYCFDRSDSDTSRGAENLWDCSVSTSANGNAFVDAVAAKIKGNNSTATPDLGHFKTLESLRWLNLHAANTSYFIPAHLERAGVYNPNGSNGFNVEHLRDFNNVAPNISFGFESMPGHQAQGQRGSYSPTAVGGGTYGGVGIYAAAIGGVWDALLGEGRNWWFFGSSDYHNRGQFGPDQLESDSDFFPGEYSRDFVMARRKDDKLRAQGIINGLRSGNSFVANGQLIDRLTFLVCAADRGLSDEAVRTLAEYEGFDASNENRDARFQNCATMGEKLRVKPGQNVVAVIVVRDPQGPSHAPYSFNNPSLAQLGIKQPLNMPVLDHVDLINGKVTGYVSPFLADGKTPNPAYAGLIGSPAASNPSAKLVARFHSGNWHAEADGTRVMSYVLPKVTQSQYVRLRGTNLPVGTPFETTAPDATNIHNTMGGDPVLDYISNPVGQTATANLPKIPCVDAACPAHVKAADGNKYSSFDVAAWSDLWFYSNPVYIEVAGSTKVAGVK